MIDIWRRVLSSREHALGSSSASSVEASIRTEFSATVFSGELSQWVSYLSTAAAARYEPGVRVRVHLHPELRLVAFEAEAADCEWLAELLDKMLHWVRERAQRKANVSALLDELLFGNPGDADGAHIVLSASVPSSGTREAWSEQGSRGPDTRFVLNAALVQYVRQAIEGTDLSTDEKLGIAWPIVSRLLSHIAYPLSTRDRYVAKIDAFARLTYLAINILYDEVKSGRLLPNAAGSAFEHASSQTAHLAPAQLFERHPYFRALGRLSFTLRALPYASYATEARIVAREYLDGVYLRLSLASTMPAQASTTLPLPVEAKSGKVKASTPRAGSHGIIDEEDEEAWKAIAKPFRDIGFILLRQIGMGDYGRVYEVQNQHNTEFPERLALKVDRILGRKQQAILEAEAAMSMGAELARAPHLIRLYDSGKVNGRRFTYHLLQLIDGDTLDALIQTAGVEHGSTGWPPSVRTSERQAREEYERAVNRGDDQEWRRGRLGPPFRYPLSAAMVLDVLTSVLLTVEEVHHLGFSINDLKNDNLMMSRRGLIKGIDLDSFARITTPYDKMTDFMFLAAAVILFMFNAPSPRPYQAIHWRKLAESEELLRGEFAISWPYGDVEAQSEGRVSKQELTDLLVDLVRRCQGLQYAREPALFSADIARVIGVKRRLRAEEFVID